MESFDDILKSFFLIPVHITHSPFIFMSKNKTKSDGWVMVENSDKTWSTGEGNGSDSEVTQSCPTLCDPIDCSLPGSSVHGIFQAIVLEWVAISFSRGSSQPRAQTWVSCIIDKCFTV